MNREQEAIFRRYHAEGKTNASFTFWVRHKLTGRVSPILGSMLSGFLCPNTYELHESNPDAVEDAADTPKKKKRSIA